MHMNKQLPLLTDGGVFIDTVTPMELRKLKVDFPYKISRYSQAGVNKMTASVLGDVDAIKERLATLRGYC